jgi:saccharopine dehydrogenase-like NADP-dependent oxidoreductase
MIELMSQSQGVNSPTAVKTGIPVSLAAQVFFNGEITQKGVLPPDIFKNSKDFLKN